MITLITNTPLYYGHKLLLMTMLKTADFCSAGGIDAAVPTLARAAGISVRTAQGYLKQLDAMGVLQFERRSRGGFGRTHRIRIVIERLQELAAGDGEGGNPADGNAQPRSRRVQTPQAMQNNPAEAAEDQLGKQFKTTPTPIEAAPKFVAPHPDTASTQAVGGGGGQAVQGRGEKPKTSSDCNATTLSHECAEAFSLLRSFGVSLGVANRLAQVHSIEAIRCGIASIEKASAGIRSKAAVLVSMLQTGEATALAEEAQETARRRVERLHLKQRTEAVRQLFRNAQRAMCPVHQSTFERGVEMIRERWPTLEQLAASPLFADENLLNHGRDSVQVFKMLVAECHRLADGDNRCLLGTEDNTT